MSLVSNIVRWVLAGTFAACLVAAASGREALGQTVIGVSAPLTGPRALLGRNLKQGVELALGEINAAGGVLNKPLSVVYEDDQGDNPNAALNAVSKLTQVSKVPVMLGPHYTVAQLATQKLFCEGTAVSLSGASGIPVTAGGCRFVIRVRANDSIQARALVAYATKELKIDRIGLLSVNDDFGRGGAGRVTAILEESGLKAVAVESHNAGDKDFSAQLSRFKSAGAGLIIMWTHDSEAGLIVRQAKQLGLAIRFAGSTSLSEPTFIKLAGDAAEGVISANDFVASNQDPRVQDFVKRYQAKYNMLPEIWAATYYDATHLAAKALNKAAAADPRKIREVFDGLQHDGLLASYACAQNGDCNHQIHIVEVKDGQAVVRSTIKLR